MPAPRDEPSSSAPESAELLAALRTGSTVAWSQLYRLHAPRLYRAVLLPRLGNVAAAEDALADTFRVAIERFAQYEPREVGIYPWLARIAHNKAMDLHRGQAMKQRKLVDLRVLLEPLEQGNAGADELFEARRTGAELERDVAQTLEAINPRYRRAIELRFFEEKGREECAALLEVKVATFDVVLLRALRSFRETWTRVSNAGKEVAHERALGTELA